MCFELLMCAVVIALDGGLFYGAVHAFHLAVGPGVVNFREPVRRAIQNNQERIARLAGRYNLTPKTVAKWKRRDFVHDAQTCLLQAVGAETAAFHEFIAARGGYRRGLPTCCLPTAGRQTGRKPTLLPLNDCLYALQATIPHLTRSSMHRCLQRHGTCLQQAG